MVSEPASIANSSSSDTIQVVHADGAELGRQAGASGLRGLARVNLQHESEPGRARRYWRISSALKLWRSHSMSANCASLRREALGRICEQNHSR